MNQQSELQVVLERLEANSRKQLLHTRIQTVICIAAGLLCCMMLLKLLPFLPKLDSLISQADTLLSELNAVTRTLAELDLSEMVENINSLVTTSQSGVEEALEKINDIDFSALNQAVKDLSDVVKPMADFVKRLSFGGLL